MEEDKKEEEIEIDFGKLKEKIKSFFKSEEKDEKEQQEEEEISFEEIIPKLKKHRQLLIYGFLAFLLIFAFVSRTQNVKYLDNSLISPDDPYLFYRYANYISEHGKIMKNDTQRHYPYGLNPDRENLGTAYLAGYLLRFAKSINPEINIYDIAKYYAPTLLVITLIAFFFLVKEIFKDDITALISTGLFAFSPAILFRTTAGFLEKEPLFLPLFVISIYFFVRAYARREKTNIRYLNAGLAGLFMGLSAFSSGLFFFGTIAISLFIIFEVLLDRITKEKTNIILIWLAITVLITTSLTTKYGRIFNFYKYLQFQIPIVALIIAGISSYIKKPKNLKIPTGIFSLLIGIVVISALGYLIMPSQFSKTVDSIITRINNPAAPTRMGLSVSENQPPTFSNWKGTFGATFIFFYFGSIILFYKTFKRHKNAWWLTILYALMLTALIMENFSRDPRYAWVNAIFSLQTFYVGIFLLGLLIFIFLEKNFKETNTDNLFLVFWFTFSTLAANGLIRLFFMLAIPAMIISGFFLKFLADELKKKFKEEWIAYSIILLSIIFIIWNGYLVTLSNAGMSPGLSDWYKAMNWIKNNTENDAVFVHWWDYGYLIQSIGERTTFVDPANWYPKDNYDVGGHLFNAHNNTEVLEFLHRHSDPDYWLICSEDLLKFYQIARLGALAPGASGREVYFSVYAIKDKERDIVPNNLKGYEEYPILMIFEPMSGPSQILKDFRIGNRIYDGEKTYLLSYLIPADQNKTGPLLAQIYDSVYKRQEILPVNCICKKGVGCTELNVSGIPTCALEINGGIVNIPWKAKDILFTKLYLLELNIPGYELVYDTGVPLDLYSILGHGTNVRIYKINYTALEENPVW